LPPREEVRLETDRNAMSRHFPREFVANLVSLAAFGIPKPQEPRAQRDWFTKCCTNFSRPEKIFYCPHIWFFRSESYSAEYMHGG